jgi:epoxyqueuosine reductase
MSDFVFPKGFLEDLGVVDWGYTEENKPLSFDKFQKWVSKGEHGDLKYLGDHRRDLRKDLQMVYPDFQSAFVFLFSYHSTKKWMLQNDQHQVAAYTLGFEGDDYHFEIKRRLKLIAEFLNVPLVISLDTQPVLERDLAYRAGLGWFGKNSMLIHRKFGSYFLIGSLVLNKKFEIIPASLEADHCGSCIKCAEACPTNAIDIKTRTLTANKCISTFTIEMMKELSPPSGIENSRGEYFGCDICQDVCPWNKKSLGLFSSLLTLKNDFSFLRNIFFELTPDQLKLKIQKLSNSMFKTYFKGTCFVRPGKRGWLKNFNSSRNDL